MTKTQQIQKNYLASLKQGSGESNNNSKLTSEQVTKIRELYYVKGYTQAYIAKIYNCSQRNISFIISYKSWV